METKGFYAGEMVKFGWRTMRENLRFFIGLLLVAWLVELIPLAIARLVTEKTDLLAAILYILSCILSIIVGMGLIEISLRFCDNERASIRDLFSPYPLFPRYLFSSILYELIVLGGLILLIFPGVIWGIKFSLFPYFIVDKGLGPVEALKASARTTARAKWDLLGFWFGMTVINFLGVVCLLIGLFAAYPTTMVATALVYRKLLSQTEQPNG